MCNIHTLAVGPLQTNCYIVWGDEYPDCVVIDPGSEAHKILSAAQQLGKKIAAILLTHGHFDHVGAVRELSVQTGCPVWLCAQDTVLPEQLTAGKLFYTDTYGEGDTLTPAGLTFSVWHTPGHTPGSVCLTCGQALFTGDTLFAGSCGRTDLPGGNWAQMTQSLSRLSALQTDYAIYPGHGEATTLLAEKRYNPYLR